MLKIRDGIDLKELEQYGFKKVQYVNFYCYKYESDYNNIIIGMDRIIHYNQFTVRNDLETVGPQV